MCAFGAVYIVQIVYDVIGILSNIIIFESFEYFN